MAYQWNLQNELNARNGRVNDQGRSERTVVLRRMEIGGELKRVVIRLVETQEKLEAACDLINDRYQWRGYGNRHVILKDSTHATFTAEVDGEVVGTITLAVGAASKLGAYSAFGEELDNFCPAGDGRACELTKFAFSPTIQSKELMAALFHIVFVYGSRTFDCTDLFIEVNPRHVRFYESMLKFQRIGGLKVNESVAAPAQLMRLEVAAIREHIDRSGGNSTTADSRSLYPFFFSPADENGIFQRLLAAGRTAPQPQNVGERVC